MIRYALKCTEGHRFDSWFQSAAAFDKLAGAGMISCAVCGSAEVRKDLMAPSVSAGEPQAVTAPAPPERPERPLSAPAHPAEQVLRRMRAFVEKHSENVGRNFVQEARAIHAGEAPARPIHGQARPEEARKLAEEGVPVAPLPFDPEAKSN
ncbi:DUF1178 family protein [Rhodosalinus sp.]|uniref:DUF1178 family protein n=1 Tax=Rhodosalinus sp. TaxID=2047741 RepID=UPI00397D7CFB